MKSGEYATIIAYNNAQDIAVKFDNNNSIRYNMRYEQFKRGIISSKSRPVHKNRVGEKRQMDCGLYAAIIRYHSSKDVDIQFDDGIIINGKTYNQFRTGKIKHPSYKKKIKQ